jgi:hypothetical protein
VLSADRIAMVTVRIGTADALAWARYIRALRADIQRAKASGRLDSGLGAPQSVHDTLQAVLAAIDVLPADPARPDSEETELQLPSLSRLRVFFHYALAVRDWADRLQGEGLLTVARDPRADRFLAGVGELLAREPLYS